MTIQNISPQAFSSLALGEWPCEGGNTIKVPVALDGSNDDINIDLSILQNTGHFSAAQTLFVDNHLNSSPVTVTMNSSYQSFTVPPYGFMYMPILQPNPPKFVVKSLGNVNISVWFINFFLPPIIWGPEVPGGAGNIVSATPVDHSGVIAVGNAYQVAIPANVARLGFEISNPDTSPDTLYFKMGGGDIPLLPGMSYETGVLVWLGDISVKAATAGDAFTAYEGIP